MYKRQGEFGSIPWQDQITNPIFAVGIAGTDLTDRPLRVIDFGGGCGIHYFAARSAFTTSLKWAVVETKTMSEYARHVAAGAFEVYEDIESAHSALGQADLVIASGAIQYAPNPMESLDALITLRARYFMLARFPVWRKPDAIGIQESSLAEFMNDNEPLPPGISNRIVKYPITFSDIAKVGHSFAKMYDLIIVLPSPSGDYQVIDEKLSGATLLYRFNGSK